MKNRVLLIAGLLAFASEAAETVTNLDFSCGSQGWIMDGRMWTVDPAAGRSGSAALVYDNVETNAYSFPFQRVTVEGGSVYKFGAWVKVDRLEHCGKPTKVGVYFDWSDGVGRFLGAAWGRSIVHNLSNTDGWEYFEGQTPVLPSQAVLGKLAAVVPRGCTGRVRVDDFMFRPLGMKAVEFVASSRYRDEGWSGMVDFHVLQHINTVRHPLATLTAEFVCTSADGSERRLRPTVFTADEAGASIAVADLAMGTHPVRYVLRTSDGKALGSAACLFTRLAADPKRRCYLDEYKRLIVDGKRFFPLGLYYYHAPFDPASPEMKRYLEGPFNTILPYSTLRPEQYDALGRAGLKVICPATGLVRGSLGEKPGCGTKEGADRVLSARINEVKGVPALIAWYDIDEAPAKQVEPLMEARETFHREDPDHPVWGVTDKPYDLRMFTRAMDIVGVDPYPIGNHPERGDIGLCADWSFEARSNMWDTVACWHVPQAFNWKNDRPNVTNPDHRFPTKEEFANMCYQLIAAGANGLIPFSYTGATSEKNDRPCGWQRVCEVFAEIRDRTDVFLSDPGPAVVSAPQGVVVRTWRTDAGETKVLAVNKTRMNVKGTVQLADGTAVAIDLTGLGYRIIASCVSAKTFVITDYGAKTDGSKVTAAFAAAMSAAADAGGGRIVVPDGRWFTGPIHFRSNCELHLSEGATVVFSQEPKDYLPAVPVSWEGIECWNYSPFVYAYCCTNVAITGKGTLRAFDGVFKDSFWKQWSSSVLLQPVRRLLYDWGATDYPVEKRRMTELERPFLRPHFIHFNRCSGIRLEDFRVRESPFWTLHLYHSENAVVRGLDVSGTAWNNDGIDIEMTRNVLVERCNFNQGDDCFVLKSGRNRDAWRTGQPTENVEIRNCHIARATSFFTCGSEVSGGIRNVWMHDCSVGECGRLCHVKTNRRRGAFVEGVRMENVTAKKARRILAVETDAVFEWGRFPDYELKTTRIGDVSLRNVHVDEAMIRLDVQGDAKMPVRGIRLENVTADVTRTGDRLVNVEDVVEDGRALPTAREFGIADFGATREDATEGIARAITAAAEAGYGRVIVPAGEWRSGPIDLLSGVELCVPSNAKLLMKDDPALYRTGDGGYRPLIRAKGAHNVRLSSGFWGIVEALTDGWQAVDQAKRPPLVGFQDCTNVVVDTIALHNTPSVVLVAERTRRLAVSGVEFIAPVDPDGFIVLRDSDDAFVSGNSYRIGDGRTPPEDPRHRVVEAVVGPKPSVRFIPVSTREAPLGVDGAGLETVSGDVRLESMDAEYDPLSDTLVKFDGVDPVTNEHYLARRYDCALAPLNAKGVFRTPPVGWMTWYSVKFDASERTILENARAFKEAFGGYTDEKPVLWVDWEWFHRRFNSKGEDGEDMLTPHAASYPRGLKALADDLKGLGFTPALWVSPQVDVRTNALFAAHPEWILASHSFWGGHVFADPTAPGYLDDFVKPLFRKYRNWGYEAFKWDCMPYTMWMYDLYHDRFHDKSVSTKEAYRRLVAAGREAIGPDAYLECCSGTGDDPMLWSVDAFDAARVGGDIFAWSSFAAEGVDQLLRYYPLHNMFLRCDADNLVLREEFNTLEQARTRVTIYALTGVPITVGDRIDALDSARIGMLRKAMPVVPMRPASLRPYFRKGNVLSLTAHFARDWGRWQVKSWSNLSTAVTEHVSFEVPAGHACWDVWNERLVTATDGKIEFELGPGASRVFRLTPLEAKGPTLLGTTRHLTQGGYELESYAATEKGATWRHKLTDRGDERLFLLYDNDVVSVPARTGSWKVEVP